MEPGLVAGALFPWLLRNGATLGTHPSLPGTLT